MTGSHPIESGEPFQKDPSDIEGLGRDPGRSSGEIPFHPLADFFPLLVGEDFESLVEDIREHGLHEPIVMYEGKILDGRNRYLACIEAGVEPRFKDFTGPDALAYVISINIKRRHLDVSRRAMIAADLEGFEHGGNRQDANLRVDRAQAAKMCSVSERSVASARIVSDEAIPELQARVRAGGVAINNAALVARACSAGEQQKFAQLNNEEFAKKAKQLYQQEVYKAKIAKMRAQALVISEGRFNVLAIDPPWDMKKAQLDVRDEEDPGLPYPTMSVEEIKQWGFDHLFHSRTTPDCWLFLSTTDSFLRDAFGLLEAWGFTYSFTMVWRKVTVNGKVTGNKLPGRPRGNCEFVLCGRRGSPRFIDTTAFDCCFDSVAREHSRKPDEFYELIKRVTEGRRIDVFSRGPHEGWEACGNELDRFPETVLPTGKFKLTLEELGL